MSFEDTFNHAKHTALFNAGKKEEAEAYRLSFIKKDKEEKVVEEKVNECDCVEGQDCPGCGKEETIEELRKRYTEKTGKKLVGKRLNAREWMMKKLSA